MRIEGVGGEFHDDRWMAYDHLTVEDRERDFGLSRKKSIWKRWSWLVGEGK